MRRGTLHNALNSSSLPPRRGGARIFIKKISGITRLILSFSLFFFLSLMSGRRYDENGNLRQWWSDETLRHYHEKVQCIIEQYGNYHLPELGDNFTVSIGAQVRSTLSRVARWRRKSVPRCPARVLNRSARWFLR